MTTFMGLVTGHIMITTLKLAIQVLLWKWFEDLSADDDATEFTNAQDGVARYYWSKNYIIED